MINVKNNALPSSFRDPSGFLFTRNDTIYRQVNHIYQEDYDLLMKSGLYRKLISEELLIPHNEMNIRPEDPEIAYKVIQPEIIGFVSYPYEWCFSQLRDAALVTLEIQKVALAYDMSLKDASAYNIQFWNGKPVLIDTLSFEKYREGQPWIAYRQFCQHLLAPLLLMAYTDIRLNQLMRIYLDGIPLNLASTLLPKKTFLKFSILSHIHFHASTQKKYEDKPIKVSSNLSRFSLLAIIDSLESAIKNLRWEPHGTEWGDYYENTNYTNDAIENKKRIVSDFLKRINPHAVWDLGANTGVFSRLASDNNIPTIAFDIDPAAVEQNYLHSVKNQEKEILPLILDLTNPSPGIGWENTERMSFLNRGPVDTILALALIHHLAISNNLPLNRLAAFFARMCDSLIIEFVPKNDSQVRKLLATRKDIFPDYNEGIFEFEFKKYFKIEESIKVLNSERTLYLMHNKRSQ